MATSVLNANFTAFASEIPAVVSRIETLKATYEEHQHRIYNLAFYLTDNELTAEEVCTRVFRNVFSGPTPSAETLDRALIRELREYMPIGNLTLTVAAVSEPANARRNVKRVLLERAVMKVPATERLIFLMHDVEGYDHIRIARTLGISTDESIQGLHQARLAVRQEIAKF
ncbi:MAG TPA: sigma factor-like helix-turn-helix DNA-binding protein [Terriglobales bacterium]|nr:sigma factor-like helix-turn-helix DNA-binding protein [Terriglobales bacterium]